MAGMSGETVRPRTPSWKFGMVVLLGLLLTLPLFSVYLLVYDRESQSQTARGSIVAGWGEPQTLGGPFLAIPFTRVVETQATENGREVRRQERREEQLIIAPAMLDMEVALAPQLRRRSIYQAVIYDAQVRARGRFVLPDLAALNIDPASVRLGETELKLGISSAKGLAGSQPRVVVDGRRLPLIPGSGLSQTAGSGFSGRLGAAPGGTVDFDIGFSVRGHDSISLLPVAQDTRWRVRSSWPHPSFLGGFLPERRQVGAEGFSADWRIGNLALNRPTVSIGEQGASETDKITVGLIDPVDLYDEVTRATKYGFLFIGFTFVALLMFDLLAGVSVPGPAYLLVGAGLVLFFVLLLALAEVIGFTPAYLLASLAIVALVGSYATAILRSRRRGALVAAMLAGLYAVLFALLSLEAYSLLIGALLLFAALAGVMYVTRNLDWRAVGVRGGEPAA
ncbi:inner membrane protein [Sphingomonas jatrophae]|uniref:Inner membrane protein n=2 Tax=Sphingomonas jatrophae TaxID=1166337 RepID=A0A1I6LDJ3_9SPHN|nr:inner membrane protein [Sphingomonas jatrophae]